MRGFESLPFRHRYSNEYHARLGDTRGAQREGMLAVEISRTFIGVSSSGKTQHFDCCIRRFESCHPCQLCRSIRMAQKTDSKSVGLIAYGFESHLRHHLSGCSSVWESTCFGNRGFYRRFESCHPDQYILRSASKW